MDMIISFKRDILIAMFPEVENHFNSRMQLTEANFFPSGHTDNHSRLDYGENKTVCSKSSLICQPN